MLPSIGRVFIRVYRLAIDARPKRGDGGADRKYPSMLEDFQTSTKSMARKRHLASTARGFLCFCLMTDRTDASHGALLPGGQYPE